MKAPGGQAGGGSGLIRLIALQLPVPLVHETVRSAGLKSFEGIPQVHFVNDDEWDGVYSNAENSPAPLRDFAKIMVYLILRSEYQTPHGRKILEFPEAGNLVDWFRAQWVTKEDLITLHPEISRQSDFDPWDWQEEIIKLRAPILDGPPCGLHELYVRMIGRKPPASMADVRHFIESFEESYGEGGIEMHSTSIQAHTNDDEIDLAWYLFDQAYADRFPGLTCFLLQKRFELPGTIGVRGWTPPVRTECVGSGEGAAGATFCCFVSGQDGSTLLEIDGCHRLPVRLPALAGWLTAQKVGLRKGTYGVECEWHENLVLLRACSILTGGVSFEAALRMFDDLNGRLNGWLPRVFSDFRYAIKKPGFLIGDAEGCSIGLERLFESVPKAGEKNPSGYWRHSWEESQFQFTPHLCQAVFTRRSDPRDAVMESHRNVSQWIFFDDLWAEANPHLAESILHYSQGGSLLGG